MKAQIKDNVIDKDANLSKVSTNKVNVFSKDAWKIAITMLVIVGSILIGAGIFGTIFNTVSDGKVSALIDAKFFFGGAFKEIADIREVYGNSGITGVLTFEGIVLYVLYFSTVIFCFYQIKIAISQCVGILRNQIKFFRLKKNFLLNSSAIALLLITIAIFKSQSQTIYIDSIGKTYGVDTTLGWGGILLLIGVCFNLIAVFLSDLIKIEKFNFQSISSYVINKIIIIILIVFVFTSITKSLSLNSILEGTSIYHNSSASYLFKIFVKFETLPISIGVLSIFSLIFTFLLVPLFILSFHFCVNERSIRYRIILFSLMLFFVIMTGLFSYLCGSEYISFTNSGSAKFSKASIVGIVLIAVSILLSFAQSLIENNGSLTKNNYKDVEFN